MTVVARTAKSNERMRTDVMKLYFEFFDPRELLFTCSTNYMSVKT